MPTYSNQIPDDPRGPALPIRRTPAFSKLRAIVTSDDLLGTYTHYYKGRTQPCERPDCEPCKNGMPYRWHAYFACEDLETALHFIFEVTATGAGPFIEYRDAQGTLRGCLFEATRWKNRPNGRILVRMKPADLTERRLLKPPNLEKCLAILWNYKDGAVDQTGFDPERKTRCLQTTPAAGNGSRIAPLS